VDLYTVVSQLKGAPYAGVAAIFALPTSNTPGLERLSCRASNSSSQRYVAKTEGVDVRAEGVQLYIVRFWMGKMPVLGGLEAVLVPRRQWAGSQVDWTGGLSPTPVCKPYHRSKAPPDEDMDDGSVDISDLERLSYAVIPGDVSIDDDASGADGWSTANLGDARPMKHKNRATHKSNPPVMVAQAPKLLAAVVAPTAESTPMAGKLGVYQPEIVVISGPGARPENAHKPPPFLVIDAHHSRPWVLGPGRGKLGHGDLKQIPCFQPAVAIGEAKSVNTPLRPMDEGQEEVEVVRLSSQPGVVVGPNDMSNSLLQLANSVVAQFTQTAVTAR
jgi:hypothetical protein